MRKVLEEVRFEHRNLEIGSNFAGGAQANPKNPLESVV
jgi:hypothetical protein